MRAVKRQGFGCRLDGPCVSADSTQTAGKTGFIGRDWVLAGMDRQLQLGLGLVLMLVGSAGYVAMMVGVQLPLVVLGIGTLVLSVGVLLIGISGTEPGQQPV
jgi:hypothetical protein